MHPLVIVLLLGLALGLAKLWRDLGKTGRKKAGHSMGFVLVTALSVFLALRFRAYWLPILALLWPFVQTRVMAYLKSVGELGAGQPGQPPANRAGARGAETMSRGEALSVLGLTDGASRDEVLSAYRELMKRVHPDTGGSDYLAKKLNQAKDVLLT